MASSSIFLRVSQNYYDIIICNGIFTLFVGGSVIPAAVKTPGNKLVRIIMPGINMVAVKKPEKNSPK